MIAKAAFYFLILCRQLLSLERYRRKKDVEIKVHCQTQGVLRYFFIQLLILTGAQMQKITLTLKAALLQIQQNFQKNVILGKKNTNLKSPETNTTEFSGANGCFSAVWLLANIVQFCSDKREGLIMGRGRHGRLDLTTLKIYGPLY